MMRILAATPVPSTGSVEPECVRSIFSQELPEGYSLDWDFIRGHDVGIQRNEIVRLAKKGGYSKLLFVDSDVQLPDGALSKLLEWDKPIVMGCVPFKNTKTGKCSVYLQDTYFNKDKCIKASELKDLPDILEVKGGGFGCVLIDMGVFDEIESPWFEYTESPSGIRRGEDISFCYKAAESEIKIFADTRVLCKHKRSDWL